MHELPPITATEAGRKDIKQIPFWNLLDAANVKVHTMLGTFL
jgi:hypothetical protein